MQPLHLNLKISERKLYRKVYNIFFEDRHREANDNLFATNCNWLHFTTFHLKKKNRQTRPRKADESVVRIEDNSFIFEISSLFQRENYNKAVNEQLKTKCSKLHSSGIQLYSGYELWKKGSKTAEILEFYTLQNSSMADN